MSNKSEVSFSDVPNSEQAAIYVKHTLGDGTLSCKIKWGFDEAQADPFHKNWTEDYFKACLKVLTRS